MKRLYLAFLIGLFGILALQAETYKGYLITKNNKRLTGYFSTISHSDNGSRVAFINDFGDIYDIHPALVSGFAYKKGEETHLYLSRSNRNRWVFLRLIYKGEHVSLLQAPEQKIDNVLSVNGFEQRSFRVKEFWLETPNRKAFPLRRSTFRKTMRRFCERGAPKLKENIGRPGFRFRDIKEVVAAFDAEKKMRKRKI